MNEGEIAEQFIQAAETEAKLPRALPSKNPRGYVLQWVRDIGDINSWRKTGFRDENLLKGDDPLEERKWAWLDEWGKLPSTDDVTVWERCIDWTRTLIDDERERRALWAWAFARAGGRPFKKWCFKIEGIHPITGRRRKNRALAKISARLDRDGSAHSETGGSRVLPVSPEIGDIPATVEEGAGERKSPNYWAPDAAFKSFINVYEISGKVSQEGFSMTRLRNAMRRHKERKRKQEVA